VIKVKKLSFYIVFILFSAACQREIHFPSEPLHIPLPEKLVIAVVVTDPGRTDYDSISYRYQADKITATHHNKTGITGSRIFHYDAAAKLVMIEDDRELYHTNNDKARSIQFTYSSAGELIKAQTNFASGIGTGATFVYQPSGAEKKVIVYDTAYSGAGYNLQWVNRIIYYTISGNNFLVYDSSINRNTVNTALVKTVVSSYTYNADSTVASIQQKTYFNNELSEWGRTIVSADKVAPDYTAFRKKLYRGLSNWIDAGSVWQDANYDLFPLPGGPYKNILFSGVSTDGSSVSIPFNRDYVFKNNYNGDQLDESSITYTLTGQGNNHYVTVVKFYYETR
jgi:hypothetical protein